MCRGADTRPVNKTFRYEFRRKLSSGTAFCEFIAVFLILEAGGGIMLNVVSVRFARLMCHSLTLHENPGGRLYASTSTMFMTTVAYDTLCSRINEGQRRGRRGM
jgi:hypothetical protein